MTTYQRARQPEQKSERRQAILAAAAALFDEEGPNGAGLNAIAARAGFTKSNVYRYFESREEVLLTLFIDELERQVPAIIAAIAACPVGDIKALAKAGTQGFLQYPRLCQLISILSSVLEQNVSEATIVGVKTVTSGLLHGVARALHDRLPGSTLEDCGWVLGIMGSLIGGIWPSANPSPVAQQVLSRPEFAGLKPVPDRDLERALRALLVSIA